MGSSTKATSNYPAPILAGLWGGVNNNFPTTPYPQTGNAASGALGDIGNLTGNVNYQQTYGGYNPWQTAQSANSLTGLAGNLSSLGVQGNQYLQGQGQNTNAVLQGAGQNVYNQALGNSQGLGGYANQALQQGFDPQQAEFNKLFQQQHEQNLASQAQSGVATTPYGAGLSQTGDQNFDIAWQQARLANQAQGANTASTLLGQSANQLGTGINALQGTYGAGANALQGLYGQGASDISSLVGAGTGALQGGAGTALNQQQFGQQGLQQQISDYLNYLTGSTNNSSAWANAIAQMFGTTNQQYSTANSAAANQAQINAGGLGGIGQALGGIGGLIGGFF